MSALLDLLRADPNVSGAFKNALGLTRAIDACTADLKAANDAAAREQHLRDRDAELSDDLGSEEWHTPYRPTRVTLKCGCEARLEEDTDGDSVWKEWHWDERDCRVLGGDA